MSVVTDGRSRVQGGNESVRASETCAVAVHDLTVTFLLGQLSVLAEPSSAAQLSAQRSEAPEEENCRRELVAGAAVEGSLRQGSETAALPLPECLQVTGDR